MGRQRVAEGASVTRRGALWFCAVAGGGDAATGLLLVVSPEKVLRLLRIAAPEGDLIFLRFVGVFVVCVGLSYLYPWLASRGAHLASVIEITGGFRLAAALFVGIAVASAGLAAAWLVVGLYDAILASAQLGLLARGAFRDA